MRDPLSSVSQTSVYRNITPTAKTEEKNTGSQQQTHFSMDDTRVRNADAFRGARENSDRREAMPTQHGSGRGQQEYPPKTYKEFNGKLYELSPSGLMIPPGMIRSPGRYVIPGANRDEHSQFNSTSQRPRKEAAEAATALTKASLTIVEKAWHSRSTSHNSRLSEQNPKQAIRPEDSMSAVNGADFRENDIHSDQTIKPQEAMQLSASDWKRNLSKRFATANGFNNFVTSWVDRIIKTDAQPDISDTATQHWKHDIDPIDGGLLKRVVFPETLRNEDDIDDEKIRMRRRTNTAQSACKEYAILHEDDIRDFEEGEENDKREDSLGSVSQAGNKQKIGNEVNDADQAEPVSNMNMAQVSVVASYMSPGPASEPGFQALTKVVPVHMPLPTAPAPASLAMPCHIRPAEEADMAGVQEIYNLEVVNGTQATDIAPVPIEDIYTILDTCRRAQLPFLVALAGHNKIDGVPSQVLGFGFFSIYQPGLAGGLNGTGQYAVKANIFVHTAHRQRGVGSAMLHNLLLLSSFNYSPKKEYVGNYANTSGTALYSSCNESPRQYHRVFAEILHGREKGLAEMWYERVLTTEFGFHPPGNSIGGAHWSSTGRCWLNKLVFQHDCYSDNTMKSYDSARNGPPRSGATTTHDVPYAANKGREGQTELSPHRGSSQADGGVPLQEEAKELAESGSPPFW